MCKYIYIIIYTCVCVYVSMYIFWKCACMQCDIMNIYKHKYINTCIMCIYIYMYECIHMYVCVWVWLKVQGWSERIERVMWEVWSGPESILKWPGRTRITTCHFWVWICMDHIFLGDGDRYGSGRSPVGPAHGFTRWAAAGCILYAHIHTHIYIYTCILAKHK